MESRLVERWLGGFFIFLWMREMRVFVAGSPQTALLAILAMLANKHLPFQELSNFIDVSLTQLDLN